MKTKKIRKPNGQGFGSALKHSEIMDKKDGKIKLLKDTIRNQQVEIIELKNKVKRLDELEKVNAEMEMKLTERRQEVTALQAKLLEQKTKINEIGLRAEVVDRYADNIETKIDFILRNSKAIQQILKR